MRTRTIAALIAVLVCLPAAARADGIEDAVTKLLKSHTKPLVRVEFSLKRVDGQGGTEVKLQGIVIGEDGLVLVTGASRVDPKAGSGNAKPDIFKVVFPGDYKKNAYFVGKDEESNLALLKITESTEKETFEATAFPEKAELRAGQQVVLLRRLDRDDDDMVEFGVVRISVVVEKPGEPVSYRLIGNLRGFEGCSVWSLDGKLAGYVTGGSGGRGGRGGRFQIIGGRMVRMGGGGGGGSGGTTRILNASTVREFLADPKRGARRDCWLGVEGLQALTKELAEAMGIADPGGLVLGKVSEKGPAERAGFRQGDVVVAMDGEALETEKDKDIASFQRKIRRAKPGEEHEFKLLRPSGEDHLTVIVKVKLEEAPISESEIPDYHDKEFGLRLKPLTRDFLTSSRLPLDSKGVRVTWVESAGWASIAGIRAGDVIQKMVLKPCPDLDAYKVIMAELMKTRDSEVCYNVMRTRKSLFLCVRPDWTTVPEAKPEKK